MRLLRSVSDAETGELKWVTKFDAHPNATIIGAPSLFEDRPTVPASSLEVALPADPNYALTSRHGQSSPLRAFNRLEPRRKLL